jgi:serine/threonine protein kinase
LSSVPTARREIPEAGDIERSPASRPSGGAGEVVKGYELVSLLAKGGMAEVHAARMRGPFGIEKQCVVKRLLPELAANKQICRMFVEEARLAVALSHPNVVEVYDADEVAGVAFYAMEFLHGHDVRRIARQAARRGVSIPLEHAVAIVLAMCAGLHYAHELTDAAGAPLKIVHRDVSPHNVFVTFDGVVKVIDFGIAKVANRLDTTQHGVLKGKFGYMSPEQCLSQPVDRRSDVFCIAIVLWELTIGKRLFPGSNEYEILKKIIETDAGAPSEHLASYPPELERIVLKGLQRDRAARYRTAGELQNDLDEFARQQGLTLSQTGLARFMERLFEEDVASWRAAKRAGRIPAVAPAAPAAPADTPSIAEPSNPRSPAVAHTRTELVTETLAPATSTRSLPRAVAALGALAITGLVAVVGLRSAAVPEAELSGSEAPASLPSPQPAAPAASDPPPAVDPEPPSSAAPPAGSTSPAPAAAQAPTSSSTAATARLRPPRPPVRPPPSPAKPPSTAEGALPPRDPRDTALPR